MAHATYSLMLCGWLEARSMFTILYFGASLTDRSAQHIDAIFISAAALAPCFAEDPVMNWCLRRPDGSTLNSNPTYRQRLFNVMMALSYGGSASFVTTDGAWKCTGVLLPPGKKLGGLRAYLACWRDVSWCLWKAGWRTSLVRNSIS